MKLKIKKFRFDYILLFSVLILVIIGCFMVYSASKYNAEVNYNNKYYFLTKQLFGVFLGLILMIIFSFINIEKLKRYKWIVLVLCLLGLILVFVPGISKTNYGATRWIKLGPITIQPSEIAKFGFVFFASAIMSNMKKNPKTFKSMLPVLGSGGLICLLIILEPNMSITMCVGITMLSMLFIGGFAFKKAGKGASF